MAEHNEIGKLGEELAVKYLKNKDFSIIERNFHVKGGEIDIIASKNFNERQKYLHVKLQNLAFIEVKTKKIASFEKINDFAYSPENNLTKTKRQRMLKAIKHYLSFRKISEGEIDIKVMAIIVFLNVNTKQAKIRFYEEFIL